MPKLPGKPALPPIAILHGPQRFLQLERTDALRAALALAHGEVAVTVFDGSTATPADVLDECRSMSLMAQHRLVVVDNADQLLKNTDDEADGSAAPPAAPVRRGEKPARELFEAYADAPDPSATLVLRAGTWRSGRLDKAVAASGGEVSKFEDLKDHQAVQWVVGRAASHHRAKIEASAAEALVRAIGPELGRLDMEVGKLALADPGKPITERLVSEMVGLSREEEFWLIQSSLLSGDAPTALSHLRDMLEVSRHDPTPLLFTYADLARKLHGVSRGLAAREGRGALMSRLRIWGPAGDAIFAKAARIPPRAAAALVADTVEAMVRQRTGQGDPEHLLEGLTLRFSALCAM